MSDSVYRLYCKLSAQLLTFCIIMVFDEVKGEADYAEANITLL